MPQAIERPRAKEVPIAKNPKHMVIVTWVDSESSANWEHEDELNPKYQLPQIETLGFIIRESDDWITLAASFMGFQDVSNQICGLMTIPRGCIRSITRLRKGGDYVRKSD